jgi:hypothetical protein
MNNGDPAQVGQGQEDYLAKTLIGAICLRGIKKLITELTSIKTLALAAMIILLFFKRVDSMWGIMGVLALTGAKEIDFTQVINIIKDKWGGPRNDTIG